MDYPFLMAVIWILLVGAPFVGMGYAIRWRRKLHLIAGFSDERVKDPDGLARWFGSGYLVIGVLNCMAVLILLAVPDHFMTWLLGTLGVTVLLSTVVIAGCRRYQQE